MMLIGRIAKESGPWWSAEVEAIGVYTQGKSRKDAAAMIKDAIESVVDREGFTVTVTEIGSSDDEIAVFVSANEPAILAAQVLKNQRELAGLTLADVQKKLGAASLNAYAAYEQGKREPSLSKFIELLHVVAPEMTLFIGSSRSNDEEDEDDEEDEYQKYLAERAANPNRIVVGEVHPIDNRDQRAKPARAKSRSSQRSNSTKDRAH